MGGIGDLVRLLFYLLPPWVVAGLAVALFLLALPGLRHGVRTRQLNGAVRRLEHADPAEQPARAAQALDLAGTDPHLLALVARHARKRGIPELYHAALGRLDADPSHARLASTVRAEVARDQPKVASALEALVKVEHLMSLGLYAGAQEHLDAALHTHPNDPGLRDLATRLSERDAVETYDVRLDSGSQER
jgi:hypothetical protein